MGTDGSSTIAKLIVDHTGKSNTPLPEHMVLLIDEVSMVDLLSAYRLVRMLLDAARVLWVGDEAQLPPVPSLPTSLIQRLPLELV